MKEPVLSEEELSEEEPIPSEEEPMLTREYLESLMKEPFLSEESEEEPLMTRERLAYVMKELLLSGISSSARQSTVVFESGHPRASTSDDSKSSPVDCVAASRTKRNNIE